VEDHLNNRIHCIRIHTSSRFDPYNISYKILEKKLIISVPSFFLKIQYFLLQTQFPWNLSCRVWQICYLIEKNIEYRDDIARWLFTFDKDSKFLSEELKKTFWGTAIRVLSIYLTFIISLTEFCVQCTTAEDPDCLNSENLQQRFARDCEGVSRGACFTRLLRKFT
jgi:hypothetical protein